MPQSRSVEAKKCSVCGVVKDASEYDPADTRGYLPSRCKKCDREEQRKRRAAKRAADPPPPPEAFSTLPRTCVECGETKPIDEFPWADKKRGFRRRLCKSCYSEFKKPITERYAEKHRADINAAHRDYHAEHREARNRARMQRYHETDPQERRKRRACTKYKITPEFFDALSEAQGGVEHCAICGGKEEVTRGGTPKILALDHEHATHLVRGFLCQKCNLGIGYFKDSVGLLEKAIEYLKDPPASRVPEQLRKDNS